MTFCLMSWVCCVFQVNDKDEGAIGSSVYVEAGDTDDIYKIPQSNAPLDNKLPPGVIYQVWYLSGQGKLRYNIC